MEDNKNHSTKISIHSLINILGNDGQVSLFSEHDKTFAQEFQIELNNTINRFGIDLTDIQLRVLEGILKGFSETDYRGNLNPQHKEEIFNQYSGKIPDTFKYLNEIPRLRCTQAQILDWAGINKNSIASKTRALEALLDLGTTQYCFYYDRLAVSQEGTAEKSKDGKWKKEQVVAVDTLFTIKKVTEQDSETVNYYEITPSPIFLDQIEGYFVLIPYKWREEVRKLVGNKKASAYTFRFLLFLRYQYELKRRSPSSKSLLQLKWSPDEIAKAIKMPDSITKRKKERMNEILENAYSVAKKLGYLTEYERLGYIDVLTFNDQKYSLHQKPASNELKEIELDRLKIASDLLEFIIHTRKPLDPNFAILKEQEKAESLKDLCDLLIERKKEDIAALIKWSSTQKYWASRLSSGAKLKKHFSEAWIEYSLSKKMSKEDLYQQNKTLAFSKLKQLHDKFQQMSSFGQGTSKIYLSENYVELSSGNHCTVIQYDDKDFVEKLRGGIKKYRFENIDF